MKKLLIAGFIIIVAGIVYFTGLYTYFQGKDVQDELPGMTHQPNGQAVATPRTIVQGSFVNVDAVHKGSGTARIISDGNTRYVRLENFNVTNGPDLYIYLSESKTPTNDIKSLDKYISLGALKGNSGNQTYEIPSPFQGYNTAVIWCQRYGVLFTYAVMQ